MSAGLSPREQVYFNILTIQRLCRYGNGDLGALAGADLDLDESAMAFLRSNQGQATVARRKVAFAQTIAALDSFYVSTVTRMREATDGQFDAALRTSRRAQGALLDRLALLGAAPRSDRYESIASKDDWTTSVTAERGKGHVLN